MSSSKMTRSQFLTGALCFLVLASQILSSVPLAHAGCFVGFRNRGVGGVSIDTHGVVSVSTTEDSTKFATLMKERTKGAAEGMMAPAGLRKISLKRLEAAIREARAAGHGILPEELQYLAGIQRIEYVLVYPEENDIVIAGPGEGWTVNGRGDVVGITTGRPVIQLDDLLVALRAMRSSRDSIRLSIDPTDEGRKQADAFLKSVRSFSPAVARGLKKAMGPQQVTVEGVPADSHFARVLLAADYRMKRLAMHLDLAQVEGLPSFLQVLKSRGIRPKNLTPRWWLTTNYEPLVRSEDGLCWQLRGAGVKTETEIDFIGDDGPKPTGRKMPAAQQWADSMTEKYDALSAKDPVFGELRNIMDLCVVAALIEKEGLLERAGCELPLMMNATGDLQVDTWHAPKTIDTHCSVIKVGRDWVISASGGVQIDSWSVVDRTEVDQRVGKIRTQSAAKAKTAWWWN